MKRETYKGRKIKVVAGRGADWGYTRITLNGVDMGKWMQSEDDALRSTRGTIDHADEVGVSSARYGAEWYAPGTFELCEWGHAKEIGGGCGHSSCADQRPQVAPVADEASASTEPAPAPSRETTIRVHGTERTIRTEVGGKVKTVKQLEAAHTKAVKAAVVETRRSHLDDYRKQADELEAHPKLPSVLNDLEVKRLRTFTRRAERGTLSTSHGTYEVAAARKPWPAVRFTDEVPAYLVEIEPGHYATEEAALAVREEIREREELAAVRASVDAQFPIIAEFLARPAA